MAALALWACAAFTILSIFCFDARWPTNLGGPVGAAVAAWMSWLFGFQSYAVAGLIAWLGRELWTGRRDRTRSLPYAIAREAIGGTVVIVALCAASALIGLGGDPGGLVGATVAANLRAYVNLGGGFIAVVVALLGGIAILAGRAPTDLAATVGGAFRSHDEPAEPSTAVDSFAADRAPLTISRPDSRFAPERGGDQSRSLMRDATAPMRPRVNGDYKLPPLA
ncbi:MAG: DNA translocase FtsK 4TM domain-containing protein, partial [Candidatus Binataceae bacterium]